MVEKKATKSAAVKATAKKAPAKRAASKKGIFVDTVNAGFRAGDVYEALHTAGEAKTVDELKKLNLPAGVDISIKIGQ